MGRIFFKQEGVLGTLRDSTLIQGEDSLRSIVNIHKKYINQLELKRVMFSSKTIFVEMYLEKGFLTTILLTLYN